MYKKLALASMGMMLALSPLMPGKNVLAKESVIESAKARLQSLTAAPSDLDQSKQSLYSEDTLVIKYKQSLSTVEHRNAGAILVKEMPQLGYSVVKVKNKADLHKAISNYQKNKKVTAVNQSVNFKAHSTMTDPKAKEQYHLSLLKIADAQKLAGKNKVTVAVIDTGIDQNHPELKGLFLPGYNVLNPMNQGTPDYHGTHVSGILAGHKNNGIGGYGINPNVKILPIDVFDRSFFTSDYTIAEAIMYAVDHGAKVINMSLGSSVPNTLLEEVVQKAINKGVTIVASAGNEGSDLPNYPASYEGVISVGSINNKKELSSYSSFGPSVDVVAPGEEIYAPIYEYEKKSSFQPLSGTSMSSPIVAGVVSLMLSKNPSLKPAQVEYILEHTATDLGQGGYDTKFGHGLVNPVAALKMDVKKVPSIVKGSWTKKEILEKSEDITIGEKFTRQVYVTKPFQQNWYKTMVNKGDLIQVSLGGANSYDYKVMARFYSDDAEQSIDINDVSYGAKEGKLIQAPFSGYMALGVKDLNGSYDDSSRKQSFYGLSLQKLKESPVDDSEFQTPIDVTSLPYRSNDFLFTGEKGDDDFFVLKTKDEQVMKISVTGVPGVDSHISIYNKENLGMPVEGKEGAGLPSEAPVPVLDFDQIGPDYHQNSNGFGKGESAVFAVNPGTEYVVRVSSKKDNFFNGMDYWSFISYMSRMNKDGQSSLLPYQVSVEGKVFPEDEDFTNMPAEETPMEEKSALEQKVFESLDDKAETLPNMYENPEEFYNFILNTAIPFKIGDTKTGYIQSQSDEDWYRLDATQTALYQFNVANGSEVNPFVEILSVEETKDEDGKTVHYLSTIGHNVSYNWYYEEFKDKIYTGLTKGKTYFIHYMANPSKGLSMDEYKLQASTLLVNPGDRYEPNDNLESIKNLPATTIEGNFAMPNDIDNFYLEGKSTAVHTLLLESGDVKSEWTSKYPKDLLNPINAIVAISEDVNKNRKLDEADSQRTNIIVKGLENGSYYSNYGSFKVEKGKNYIVSVMGMVDGPVPLSLRPYKMTVAPTPSKDEDKGNVIKNYTPSKPIALKKVNNNTFKATGYLNTGIAYGDEDWYVLDLKQSLKGFIHLQGGHELDGVITLYQNGKQVNRGDYYPRSQTETLPIELKKGKYYIKVKDALGNATIKPYTLVVEKSL
ncbi:S8 family peptidase [Peribacillus alkalitolerans]|uniref:S8 family peptidase n=1 Tax=Peribacillus alkalitolerans TaxID=1550385 RepID=UPI001F07B7DC|nr:S8 family serine peptidase [Peribacillus alkalitolerans]